MRSAWLGLVLCVALPCNACKDAAASAWNARVAQLEARLKAPISGYRSQSFFGPDAVVVPWTAVSRPLEIGAVVRIVDSELAFEDTRLGPAEADSARAALGSHLTELARNYAVLHPGKPTSVYFMAAPEVPSATLTRVVASMPSSMAARLLVRHGDIPKIDPIPARASKDARAELEKLLRVTGAQRTTAYADAVSRHLGPCAPARVTFGRVAAADAFEKDNVLIKELPRALERCPFAVDLDLVEGIFVAMLSPAGPPMGWLPLELRATADGAEPLDVRVHATVGKLAKALSDAERAGRRTYLASAPAADAE